MSQLPSPSRRFITTAEALKEDFKGRTNYWLCRPEIADAKDLQLCRAVLPAGEGHPFHTHPELEEIIYVLEGQVEQWVETEKRMLQPGEVAHIPAGVVHATFNPTGADAVILAILSPSKSQGPFMVDVSGEEPWKSLRTKAYSGTHPLEGGAGRISFRKSVVARSLPASARPDLRCRLVQRTNHLRHHFPPR